ncbi:MAG: DNA translocase FtsK [Epsilonproteobacteria bacterium]|nr:DNA translocase FtsK [Campylobacterota bacterium]NPA57458.1 DNA translocase FtsK [Campylobacterota bacterium]
MLFLGLSTLFVDFQFVGKFGELMGSKNRELFGFLSYIYPFLLIIVLISSNFRKSSQKRENIPTLIVAIGLLIVALILLQALLLPDPLQGRIGKELLHLLAPYIGIAGLWLLLLLLATLVYILLDLNRPLKRVVEQVGKVKGAVGAPLAPLKKSKGKGELPPLKAAPTKGGSGEEKRREGKGEREGKKEQTAPKRRGKRRKGGPFQLPPGDLLQEPPPPSPARKGEIEEKSKGLLEKLGQFKIDGEIIKSSTGPLVTTFEFKPAPKVKVSKILNLADDLAMALKAPSIRIQAPVPGKDVVGIEIPNGEPETIYLREIIESEPFQKSSAPLTIALGKDTQGRPFVTDLAKLPHLLIAGTTGSGKSVGINGMVLSLLYRNTPKELRLMMVDPKMLEFAPYDGIPHLLTPVITDPQRAVEALGKMVEEMERRYKLMSEKRSKNIESFNKKAEKGGFEKLPYIVVIIDELADLMITGGKDLEYSIARLAQMARAAGIHLIVATQRPSVDVVTGLIKANLPARISFRVGQKVDSRVILDSGGAESLIGRGDMLFVQSAATPIRLHAPWVSEQEIEKVTDFLKEQGSPDYDPHFTPPIEPPKMEVDPLYEAAKEIVLKEGKGSSAHIQKRLEIGQARAAKIVEQLRQRGVLPLPRERGSSKGRG